MLTKKSRIVIAALGSIFCFLSAVYVSCTKPGPKPSCNGVVCKNGGYCNRGACTCSVGWEGTDCGIESIARYIGTWDVDQRIIGSDSPAVIGRSKTYQSFHYKTATPTTFFIHDFLGNPTYNELLCVLDSADHNNFVLDSVRDQNMIFGTVYIRPGSKGSYDPATQKIHANFIVRHLTPTHNWEIDTYQIDMRRHIF